MQDGKQPASVGELLRQLKTSGELDKVAEQGGFHLSPEDEEMQKTAADVYNAGLIFGRAAVQGMMDKLAESPVPATGQTEPSQGDTSQDKSQMKSIADKVMGFKGIQTPGSTPGIQGGNPNVVAETTAPPQVKKPNPEEKTGG